jgi:hypothetical protein
MYVGGPRGAEKEVLSFHYFVIIKGISVYRSTGMGDRLDYWIQTVRRPIESHPRIIQPWRFICWHEQPTIAEQHPGLFLLWH